ncbi:cytochrome c3 family protein [candidate division KSB1 bacterium]
MKIKLPDSSKNFITFSGVILAVISVCIFWALYLLAGSGLIQVGSYFGLVLYVVLPVPFGIGLVLIPLGMYLNRKAVREKIGERRLPVIDLNNERHRHAAMIFSIGTIFVGFFVFFVSYQGFHYTESTEFCGKLCHSVMKPEYITYSNSPHAKVPCVHCHVGAGADWYARSKLSGLYQVYATILDKYPRPIETPIKNLRPARETCEECHWPGRLFPARERRFNHYLSDEENRLWTIKMIVEIGGSTSDIDSHPGSHWHIHEDVKVEYIATDEKRFEIPWVRLTYLTTGEEIVFQSEDSPIEPEKLPDYEIRTMDCIDCHTRPSHSYKSPKKAINEYMFSKRISTELPEIKMIGVEYLNGEYTAQDSGAAEIRKKTVDYYSENYPDLAVEMSSEIREAADALAEIYLNNYFPSMKSSWAEYPDHIGHLNFPGCFRCHNGNHVTSDNRVITHECNSCHIIVSQGDEIAEFRETGLEFRHPIDIGEAWKEMPCTDCHSPDNQ